MKKLVVLLVVTLAFAGGGFAQKKPVVRKTDAGQTVPKMPADPMLATWFVITVEHNGDKIDFKNTQFESFGGAAFTNDSNHGLMTLNFRAGNDKSNDDNFAFEGSLNNDAKGTLQFEEGQTHFSFMSTQLAGKPELLCQKGAYEITAMPLKGGYVEGSFTAQCEAGDPTGDHLEHYNLSGSFKLLRQ